ncbi:MULTISPECIES: DUF5719 family protein [Kitasatospora]|uniref:DUF5719 family protein n=1 Tax=Kitasatospora TaxID=2063 RepID=UPI000C702DE9|nr:DUF5719 family protein [Kitasatospora sp. GP30]MDH6140666.1 hypothetical protein [Kitasatospora sp. GP30]
MKMPAINLNRPADGASGGGGRTGRSLLACVAVLAAVLGVAELRQPAAPSARPAGSAAAAQVERTAVVCPQPMQGLTGTTQITAITPADATGTGTGSATVSAAAAPADGSSGSPAPSGSPSGSAAPSGSPSPSGSSSPSGSPAAGQSGSAMITLAKPGVPVSATAATGDTAPGSTAVATGALAPGFTVTQTTTVTDQRGEGMSGVTCAPSGTHFWFAGASTAGNRKDYLSLTDAENTAAVVDIKLYGDQGPIDTGDAGSGIAVAPGTSQSVLLTTLTTSQTADLAVEVRVRSGRVGAYLHASDGSAGSDWIPASADPASTVVVPGLPGDLSAAHLVVAAPGSDDDADLKIQLSGQNGWFSPVLANGQGTVHVKAGMVTALDLGQLNRQQISAVRLTPSDPSHPTPVIATVRIDRSSNGKSDSAWISGAGPVGKRATVADSRAGGVSTLLLTATGDAATVRVTASASTGGGTPTSKDVQIPAGGTVGLASPEPAGGNGSFGLTVETTSGSGVVAARMLAVNTDNVPMFTIQALQDDHSFVQVPQTQQDPGVLLH